ncbi:MAG: adenylate/guanylate cyclase domain-containing protein, partial [Gammaproteobacteria bacterium]|nr:adenylate/guanylate cyclase domain-containing protein [Gammaproteobacteria bacterium]
MLIWIMITDKLEQLRAPLVGLALGIVASLVVIGLRGTGILQFVELANYDIYLRLKEQQTVIEPRVILVQTVETDIQKLGEWPLTDA